MIPLSNINIGEREKQYANDALNAGWISGSGHYVTLFETLLAERIGRRHVIATANGTLALVLALQALGVGQGDEVIVPALTFAAPAAAVKLVGATPVLVDVHPLTWTIDPALVKVTERTKALIAVDALGHPADYDALRKAAGSIPIIQDAAEAHGARYKNIPVGKQGDISIFSFHANKAISTGEGGCVMTDDHYLAESMRLIANHGMTGMYWHNIVGSNYRMSNLVAAVGAAQVERWGELIEARRDVARLYDRLLPAEYGRRGCARWARTSTWLYCIRTPNRDNVLRRLKSAGVDARALWRPLPEMPPYRNDECYPVAKAVSDTGILLPTWAGMGEDQVQEVVKALTAELIPG